MTRTLVKKIVIATLLSIVVFFAISFITVLMDFAPIDAREWRPMIVGFPFSYYKQFHFCDGQLVHHEWGHQDLLIDCFIT